MSKLIGKNFQKNFGNESLKVLFVNELWLAVEFEKAIGQKIVQFILLFGGPDSFGQWDLCWEYGYGLRDFSKEAMTLKWKWTILALGFYHRSKTGYQ